MKKGEIYTGKVLKVGFPNRGIAEIYDEDSAMPLFLRVKDVLPGQTIRARIIKKRAGRPEGSLVEVTERAEYECESQCNVFPDCGGCAYQTVPYEKQLEIKSGMIRELLGSAIGEERFERIYKGIIPSPRRLEYRNKMEFTFGNPVKDGPLTLGMHRRHGFHDILPAGGCLLVDKDVRLIVSFTESFFREKNIPFYHRMNHTGFLRHLLVRKGAGSGEILLDLITTSSDEYKGLIDEWADGIRSLELDGTLTGILHTKNDSPADAVVDQGTDTIFGRNYFYEKILGLNFKITPFSFFQTNTLGAEKLYETAMSMISDINNKTVYDLYCGTGTITSVIAKRAGRAIGVEIVPEAVDAARENAEENKIKNVEFICGDVLKVLDEMPCPPDMIVLDPPRDGVNPRAMKKILSYGVNEILYISCKPTSLARDLPAMIENGYDPSEIRCVDMFPATTGVETVVQLSKGDIDKGSSGRSDAIKAGVFGVISGYSKGNKAPETTNVKIDFSLENLDLSELRGKATYEQIKDYVREQTGVRVSALYISQVKRKCGLEVGESYNKPKSEDSKQPQCTPEKEEAIMQALRHYGVI